MSQMKNWKAASIKGLDEPKWLTSEGGPVVAAEKDEINMMDRDAFEDEDNQPSELWKMMKDEFNLFFSRSNYQRHLNVSKCLGYDAQDYVNDLEQCKSDVVDMPTIGLELSSSAIEDLRRCRALVCVGSSRLSNYESDGKLSKEVQVPGGKGTKRRHDRGITMGKKERTWSIGSN